MRRLWLTLAGRELLVRPWESALVGMSLSALTAVVAGTGLLARGAEATARAVLADGPDIVVRRVAPDGFRPVPADREVAVTGVTRAEARVWGVVASVAGPVTLVGDDEVAPGESRIGTGVLVEDDTLVLRGQVDRTVRVTGRFAEETALVTHDLVSLHPDDARALLGLGPGEASDLALWVHFPAEADALLPDLEAALPWPVQATTRERRAGLALAAVGGRASFQLALLLPALLALLALGAGAVRDRLGRHTDLGLLSALGWTRNEVVRLQVLRALLLVMPSVTFGVALAYSAVHGPGGDLVIGWLWPLEPPLRAALSTDGALVVLGWTAAFVVMPYVAVVAAVAALSGHQDPVTQLEAP